MKESLWLSAGGIAGTLARYWIGSWVAARMRTVFPYGTFLINVSGSFTLGLLMGLVDRGILTPALRLMLAVGFCGAYTTFSTFVYETLRLVQNGSVLFAVLNVAGSLVTALLFGLFGLTAGRLM
jgi:CrcB protein